MTLKFCGFRGAVVKVRVRTEIHQAECEAVHELSTPC